MTLKQLEAFYWAASCGSFAIAAERLNIAQSSLSKRIGELEAFLGCQLFDREQQRRAILTPAGSELLPRARGVLSQVDALISSMDLETTVRGRCRFGVGEIAASSWLPTLVTRLRKQYPDVKLEPFVDLGEQLEAKLLRGELDAAMIARQSTSASIESVALADVEFVWVVRADLATRGRYAEDIVQHMPVVTMSSQAGSTTILDDWRRDSDVLLSDVIQSNSMTTMLGLTAAGVGIGYFPRGWIRPLLARKLLRPVPSRTPLKKLCYRFHWRAGDTRPLIARLRELTLLTAEYDTSLLML